MQYREDEPRKLVVCFNELWT